MTIRRRSLLVLVALTAFSMPRCTKDTGWVSLRFEMTKHEKLTEIDRGKYKVKRLVFADHHLWATVDMSLSEPLSTLDNERAKQIEAGGEVLPMDVRVWLSAVNEVVGQELLAANVVNVSIVQGSRSSNCQPRWPSKTTPVRAPFFPDAGAVAAATVDGGKGREADSGGQREADGGKPSPRKTKNVLCRCELAYAPFQLILEYRLDRAGKAEPSSHKLVIPFKPSGFGYKKYNKSFATCMSV